MTYILSKYCRLFKASDWFTKLSRARKLEHEMISWLTVISIWVGKKSSLFRSVYKKCYVSHIFNILKMNYCQPIFLFSQATTILGHNVTEWPDNTWETKATFLLQFLIEKLTPSASTKQNFSLAKLRKEGVQCAWNGGLIYASL